MKSRGFIPEAPSGTLGLNESFTPSNMQQHNVFVNEPALYSLIMKSKMTLAEEFQDWFTSEVLPSVGKTGEYKIRKQMKELYEGQVEQLNNIIRIERNHITELNNVTERAIRL
jgi:prophage antirepressor-like protein